MTAAVAAQIIAACRKHAAYDERLAVYGDIAGEHGADVFIVGTLLTKLDGPRYTDRWTELLLDTRDRCGCRATYSAESIERAGALELWQEARGAPSEAAQAALYDAAFRALRGTPWIAGIGWFELSGDGLRPRPADFSFEGKRAEDVLRAWQTAR